MVHLDNLVTAFRSRSAALPATAYMTPAPAPVMGAALQAGSLRRRAPATHEPTAKLRIRLAKEARQRDLFMATLAHELRNAIAPLGNALEILGSGRASAELVAQTIPMAQRQLRQMTHLVQDLMDVGRIVNDRIELTPQRVSLQSLVEDAVAAFAFCAVQRRQTVAVRMPDEPVWANIDAARMAQVLSNLLGNASKFTPAGARIEVSLSIEGSQALLSVSDQGIGIAPEDIGSIFDLFRQAEAGKACSGEGLGIGLAVVRKLVELHGGTVTAHSAGTNAGSTFTLRLPLAD